MIAKIKSIIESMGLPFRYGNPSQINYYLNNVDYSAAPDGVAAYCYLLTDSEYVNGKERATIAVCFSKLIPFDFNGSEAVSVTDDCKSKAKEFLHQVAIGNSLKYQDARFQYGYNDFAENVAWCAVRAVFEVSEADCWPLPKPHTDTKWMKFTAIDGPATISIEKVGSPLNISVECSRDGENWQILYNSDESNTIELSEGEYLYIRGENAAISSTSISSYHHFLMTGKVEASGNITSILNNTGDDMESIDTYALAQLFYHCDSLITAPFINITNPNGYRCLLRLFGNCYNLSTVKVKFLQWNTANTFGWMSSVGNNGDFYLPSGTAYIFSNSGVPTGWTVIEY